MKCQNCNHTVTRKSKFCPNCGDTIIPRTSQKQASVHKGIPIQFGIGLIGLGILVGFLIFKYASDSGDNSVQTNLIYQSSHAQYSAAVLDIARDFMCNCGNCGDDTVEDCNCEHKNGALEVKNFILQKVQEGHKKPHIVALVQEKYGGLKKESEPLFKLESPFSK